MKWNGFRISSEQKRTYLIAFAVLVSTICVLWNGVYLVERDRDAGFGRTDTAVFYAAGKSVMGEIELAPQDLYVRDKLAPALKQFRQQKGGTLFVYLPPAAAAFVPFTVAPIHITYRVWVVIVALLFILGYYLALHWFVGEKKLYRLRYSLILLILAFSPAVRHQVAPGQINTLLWIVFMASFYFLAKKKEVTGGVYIAIGTIFKMFPALFGVYALMRKQWKAVWVSAGVILVSNLIMLPIFGIEAYRIFFTQVLPSIAAGDAWGISQSASLYGSFMLGLRNGAFSFLSIHPAQVLMYGDIIHLVLTLAMAVLVGRTVYRHREEKGMAHVMLDYTLILLFILLFSKNIHRAFFIWLLPVLLYMFKFPLMKSYLWVHGLGVIIFVSLMYYEQLEDLIGLFYVRPATISMVLLLCLVLFLRYGGKHFTKMRRFVQVIAPSRS